MKPLSRLTAKLNDQRDRLWRLSQNARDEGAQRALERAKSLVPVRTGRLRASLSRAEGRVYTRCAYAPAVELGTGRCAPRPFLSAAADMNEYCRLAEQAYREAMK